MAAIKITPDEFVDIIIAFLLDKMIEDDVLKDNEEFNEIINKMLLLGLRPYFLKHYIRSPPSLRNKYKIIKKTFTDKSQHSTINIASSKEEPKSSKFTDKIKKILKIVNNSKKKNMGIPLSEDKIDGIIKKVMEE